MSQETKKFTAEVGKVLHLMIHSLYTNKDIFLREIVSNASDACDKLRYLAQTDSSLISSDDNELKILLSIDKDGRKVIIEDNGIGMNQEDLIENLGTIAKSGTQQFLQQLTGDSKKDSNLIGQFGVGFYSSFMVADNVTVISTKAGTNETYKWYSEGEGEYTIDKITDSDLKVGTRIIVHIKENLDDYLDHFRVKHIVKTYSDHIAVPIYFVDEAGNKVKLNSSSALWARSKSEITDEQYQEFYKSVAYSADTPWLTMHNKNEGTVEYTNLLFIPTNKTFDLFHPDRKRRVKLYIKRVFITDEGIELVPHYMRFLRGVVDSEDLPLNISRENLQHNATIDKIRSSITKRVISELAKKKEEARGEYEAFWKNFGAALKEGLCEVTQDPEKLLELCLFYSCKQDKFISLDEYIASLPAENNKTIHYLSGENPEKLKNSPQIEGFLAKNIDVLIFTDPVDDFWVNVANKYKEYDIKSATRAGTEIETKTEEGEKTEEKKETSEENEKLIEFCKSVLVGAVKDVIISKKLTSSPSCISVGEGDMDIRMERFLIEQKQLNKSSSKILEINPAHPILQKILKSVTTNINLEQSGDLVWLLFDQACIIEGEPVIDASSFSARLVNIMESI